MIKTGYKKIINWIFKRNSRRTKMKERPRCMRYGQRNKRARSQNKKIKEQP